MHIAITTRIASPVDKVWELLADNFATIENWSASVFTSKALTDLSGVQGAPVPGRYCTFTEDPNGLGAREKITTYDKANHRLAFHVQPINADHLPLRENNVHVELERVGPEETELRWESKPGLKPYGYLLYPFIRSGLAKAMQGVVAEFKVHAESCAI